MTTEPDEMFTIAQAAVYLGVEQEEITRLIRQGKLRSWGIPHHIGLLVRKEDLKKLKKEKE